jgi:peptide/nickel transport system permease protein
VAVGQARTLIDGVQRKPSLRARTRRLATRHTSGLAGGLVIVLMLLVALFAGVISTHSPTELDPVNRLVSPNSEHLFGTDNFGRDLFSRTLHGSRVSLLVGFGVSVVAIVFGTLIGLVAGYYRQVEGVLMRLMDAVMAFPGIILAIGIVAVTGPSVINVIIALGVVYIPRVARLTRSVVLSIREMQYIEAAKSIGVQDGRIIRRHILVNVHLCRRRAWRGDAELPRRRFTTLYPQLGQYPR